MFKSFQCSRCSKGFSTESAAEMHIKDKHKGVGEPKKTKRQQSIESDDESMADRSVQAQLDKAMGIYNFDQEWLLP